MSLRATFRSMRDSGLLHNLGIFAAFVLVAAVFWSIMALNDEAQVDFEVKVRLTSVPDSVTFITDPPGIIHVSVRDRGAHLLRLRLMHEAVVSIDFKEYADDGVLRIGPKALLSHVRSIFGQSASVSIISADSIVNTYTTSPGKLVPVRVNFDVTPVLGKVVSGAPRTSVKQVKIFSSKDIIDTIAYVGTETIVARDVEDSFSRRVNLKPIPGVRMEPPSIEVTIGIEPLENRTALVPIQRINVPQNQSIVLFPEKVEVNYLVPMSHPDVAPTAFLVQADYRRISHPTARKMPLILGPAPPGVRGATLAADSVEFTIIHYVDATR